MAADKRLISPIAPEPYGDRFIEFIEGITKSPEEAARDEHIAVPGSIPHTNSNPMSNRNTTSLDSSRRSDSYPVRVSSTNATILRNEHEAAKSERRGDDEGHRPEPRRLTAIRSPSAERSGGTQGQILPVVEEMGEASSTGGRSARSRERDENIDGERRPITPAKDYNNDGRPVTPAKDYSPNGNSPIRKVISRSSLEKELPLLPQVQSPAPMSERESVFS
jgi:1-phosphatidylinositol-4-phosphate 5-kinase